MKVEMQHVNVPCRGEVVSGDLVLWHAEAERAVLVVVDALGHGPKAAAVAEKVADRFDEVRAAHSVEDVLTDLDDHLRGTRGAAVLACVFGRGEVEVCSVGNVDMRGVGVAARVLLTPGVVGVGRLPRFRTSRMPLPAPARVVAFSDGVSGRFDPSAYVDVPAPQMCRELLEAHGKEHDDATVAVVDLVEW